MLSLRDRRLQSITPLYILSLTSVQITSIYIGIFGSKVVTGNPESW